MIINNEDNGDILLIDSKNNIPKKKLTATEFLEKYKIWFNTVLSFALTFAAVMISIASYNVAKYQAQLNERSINNLDLEKQPYFSIENKYIEDEGEYTYIVKNTGGDVRYINMHLTPYLYIERVRSEQYEPLNYAFIELPGLYRNSEMKSDDILFAFKDYTFFDKMFERDILADYLFDFYTSWFNIGGMDTSMHSQIFYSLQISYVNYKNEYKVEIITFSRGADTSGKTKGNTILRVDMSERFLISNMSKKYNIDSYNLTDDEIMKQCKELIENLCQEFGQVEDAEVYEKENYGR